MGKVRRFAADRNLAKQMARSTPCDTMLGSGWGSWPGGQGEGS